MINSSWPSVFPKPELKSRPQCCEKFTKTPLGPFLAFSHIRGLNRQGDRYRYISLGVGSGGPPVRLGSSPGFVSILLHSLS